MARWMGAVVPLFALLVGGCANYEFDLVRPQDIARHIGPSESVIALDPLHYRLQAYEGRLVMRIENPTNDSIQLLGSQSTVVDPGGQSHPLRNVTIAPGSFVKLIFPPLRPRFRDVQPTFGIGFGAVVDRRRGCRPYPVRSWAYEPRYLDYYDESDVFYFDWDGETDIRIILVYQRGEREFRDSFTFHRKKM